MSQLIVPITHDFELNLHNFMNLRGISTETEAIIIAVKESLERATYTVLDTTPSLEAILEQVAIEKKRLTLIYQDKVFLAIVPKEDVDVIKQLTHAVKTPNKNIKTLTALDLENALLEVIVQNTSQVFYHENIFLAVVPIEYLEFIEIIEDSIDNANANDALKEQGSISLDEFRKELGL
jgi:hypothetical protein